MSKECICKTNREMGAFLHQVFLTKEGWKGIGYGAACLATICIIMAIGMWLLLDTDSLYVFIPGTIVTMGLAIMALIYMITLIENCEKDDGTPCENSEGVE